jgi:hypothetical protein
MGGLSWAGSPAAGAGDPAPRQGGQNLTSHRPPGNAFRMPYTLS